MSFVTGKQVDILFAFDPWALLKFGLNVDEDGNLAIPESEGFGYRDGNGNILVSRSAAGNLTYSPAGFPSGGTISSYEILDDQRRVLAVVTGFAPVSAATFNAAVIDNTLDRYLFLVSLLDDATTATGGAFDDIFEVGAGNDTVNSGAGDDTAFKWKAGNLTYDGGIGADTLSFQAQEGSPYPTGQTELLIVNLTTNLGGRNPYGGTLDLSGVENIVGTLSGDIITGNGERNVIGDGVFDGGNDTINALGGNDLVRLAPALASGAQINGGTGTDELSFTLGRTNQAAAGSTILDLMNQANSTGLFEGVTIFNFETFTVDTEFVTLRTFTFRGTNAAETVLGSVFVTGTSIPNGKDFLFGGGGNDILDGRSGDDTVNGEAGDDTLIYSSGADIFDGGTNTAAGDTLSLATLTAGVAINLGLTTVQGVAGGSVRISNVENLVTGSGNDLLNGAAKAGANKLTGNAGNDTYTIGAGDTIIEAATPQGGIDTVQVAASHVLAAALENLVLLAGGAFNGNGNGANNVMTGNSAANTLSGLGGDDTLAGLAGADRLDGGAHATLGDTVTYAASNAGVTVNLARTLAQVSAGHASGDVLSGIENVTGSAFADTLSGTAAANRINGLAGADTLRGLGGNDTYTIDQAGDVADESVAGSGGLDTVVSSIAFSLSDAAHAKGTIENLTLTGTLAIAGTGNASANVINGALNTAANALRGLGDSDSYIVGANDIVDESVAGSSGIDTIFASVLYSLSDTAKVKGAVENLTLIGSAGGLNATGNNLNNVLTGSATANALFGEGGNDTLNGAGSNDFLDGGIGADTLTGGAGLDTFFFTTALAASNIDTLTDFSTVDDSIRIDNAVFSTLATTGPLASAAFKANATGLATDGDDRIVYNTTTGALIYDSNGNLAGGAIQFALLTAKPALSAADFVVF